MDDGTITQDEFEREKARLLSMSYTAQPESGGWDLGIDEKSFVALMHASQFISSFIAPLIMWLMFRNKSLLVDQAGKNILNFQISYAIYFLVLFITCIGILLAIVIPFFMIIFMIIAILKAANGETWKYPLSIPFLK